MYSNVIRPLIVTHYLLRITTCLVKIRFTCPGAVAQSLSGEY